MKTQHTPGPWVTAYTGDATHVYSETNDRIATIPIRDSAEQMENARLIAAAPELLAALQTIARIGGTTSETAIARAAITRATTTEGAR